MLVPAHSAGVLPPVLAGDDAPAGEGTFLGISTLLFVLPMAAPR